MAKKFFRSVVAGLKVVVGEPDEGSPVPKTVGFTAYEERDHGEKVTVGYLATSNDRAIEVLATDPNVEEIDEKEFKKATDESDPKTKKAVS